MEMRSDGYAQDWLKLKWMSKYEKFYFVLDMKWNTAAAASSCSFFLFLLLLLFKSIKNVFFGFLNFKSDSYKINFLDSAWGWPKTSLSLSRLLRFNFGYLANFGRFELVFVIFKHSVHYYLILNLTY